MKYAYCPVCDRVSVLSNMEPERCQGCGKVAYPVKVPRTWQYFTSAGVILAGAAAVILTDLPDILQRFLLLVPFLVVGLGFSTWGMRTSRTRALERGRAAHPKEAKA